ncbi:acyltransferase family protein [Gimesia maris]|uniref:acyltransferase family protein n=1 Tax=Gimesia maris TaxID=122 RepID=UPI003A8D3F1D
MLKQNTASGSHNHSERAQNISRIAEVDALRGIAALGVVWFHFTSHFEDVFGAHKSSILFEFPFGRQCVDLFFMISGFVILMTAERCAKSTDFLVARFARLYPAYWCAVAFAFSFCYFTDVLLNKTNSRLHALVNLSMVQKLVDVPHVSGVFWSLYVELSFYVLVAVLICLSRLELLRWVLLALAVVYAMFVKTSFGFPQYGDVVSRFFPIVEFAHYFCFGVWVYLIREKWDWRFVPVVSCLWLCALLQNQAISALVNGVVFTLAVFGRLPWLPNRLFLFLGTISYSLYLVHDNFGYVLIIFAEKWGVDSNVAVLVATVASVCVASALCFYVERPANRLIRGLWAKSKSSKTPTPSSPLS